MPSGILLGELEGDTEMLLVPADGLGRGFGVLAVERSILKGNQGAVDDLEIEGLVIEKDGVKVAVHFEQLGDAAVGGVVAVNKDLDSGTIGKVECEHGMSGGAASSLENLANDFTGIYTGRK